MCVSVCRIFHQPELFAQKIERINCPNAKSLGVWRDCYGDTNPTFLKITYIPMGIDITALKQS